jgi:catechol 2,3-dioxygenase-like lactoylglutathione lyase family enzyme
MILFTKVDSPPATSPPGAIWHFGWHVSDVRANIETYRSRAEIKLLPLYTTDEGGSVLINSDTWPAPKGGAPGLTRAQIAEAKANHTQPLGGGGFAYMRGPDGALVEYVGDHPAERFDHVHLWQEDPYAAAEWYQVHLNAPLRAGSPVPPTGSPERQVKRGPERSWPALNQEGMFRDPRAGVVFGDVALAWYSNQWDSPLVSSRGQLQDHIALSVVDLDAWIRKLQAEGVVFLEQPYRLGGTRAVMIEGPSKEALELVEVTSD